MHLYHLALTIVKHQMQTGLLDLVHEAEAEDEDEYLVDSMIVAQESVHQIAMATMDVLTQLLIGEKYPMKKNAEFASMPSPMKLVTFTITVPSDYDDNGE
jgi:hypothetical protein